MIDPKEVARALTHQRKEQTCDHPTDQIMDRPDKSYCRKCGQDVEPDTRHPTKAERDVMHSAQRRSVKPAKPMDWMGRVRKSVFPVFPSGG